jgi:hypothetical protein
MPLFAFLLTLTPYLNFPTRPRFLSIKKRPKIRTMSMCGTEPFFGVVKVQISGENCLEMGYAIKSTTYSW